MTERSKDPTMSRLSQAREDALQLLSGEVTPDHANAIERSCQAPEYQQELLETIRLMASLDELEQDSLVTGVLDKYQRPSTSRRPWRNLAVAATLLLAVAVGWHLIGVPTGAESTQIDRYLTRVGEQREVTLADGTLLAMNTGTSLLVEMSDTGRQIILERGELFVDVVKDPLRPFTVTTGDRAISVLGTAFNVHRLPDRLELAVSEGTVVVHQALDNARVSAPLLAPEDGQPLTLEGAGQRRISAGTVLKYSYDTGLLLVYADTDIERHQRWRNGMLSFQGASLDDIVQELNRYSAKKILLESRPVTSEDIYATIRIDQIPMALEGLQSSLPIKVVIHFDRIVISDAE